MNHHNDYLPRQWDSAIKKLGTQFCVPKGKIEKIIVSVKALEIDDNDVNYRRAWRMLMDAI